MAQQYGTTPWGKWFLDVLDSYKMGERLARGKSYANTGKVTKIQFDGRTVTARVAGRSSPYYGVVITFPLLKNKEEVYALIERDPMLLSRITAGELPPELLAALKKSGIALIPQKWRDMQRSCSCPDSGDPCKHMAAVYYIIARQIDANPSLLFSLRGIDLSKRFGVKTSLSLEPPFTIETAPIAREIPEKPPALVPDASFLEFTQSLVPSSPSFSERDFSAVLAGFYKHAARFHVESDDSVPVGLMTKGKTSSFGSGELERMFSSADISVKVDAFAPGTKARILVTPVSGDPVEFSIIDTCQVFLLFSSDSGSAEYRFLFYLARLLRTIWNGSAFAPVPFVSERELEIVWRPIDKVASIKDAINDISRYECALFPSASKAKSASARKAVSARSSVDILISAFLTQKVRSLRYSVPGGDEFFRNLFDAFFSGAKIRVDKPALQSLPLAIDTWLSVFRTDFSAWKYRFCLSEKKVKTQSPVPTFNLSLDVVVEGKSVPLKDALDVTGDRTVLSAPVTLSAYLPEILELSKKNSVSLSEKRLVDFLDTSSPILSRLGVGIVLPKNLHGELKPRLVLRANSAKKTSKKSTSLVSYLDMDSLLSWEWAIAIGDEVVSADEFELLVEQKSALVCFRDGYIRLDPLEVSKLLKQTRGSSHPEKHEFIRSYLAGEAIVSEDVDKSLQKLFSEHKVTVPASLNAELRPYQERGLNWVYSLLTNGFGCILADDMGLGKTVQAIAVLLRLEEDGALLDGRTLIVAPAALLSNWERELSRFAPDLTVKRFHGTARSLSHPARVMLTTYQTAVRDFERLKAEEFTFIIADEAHLMKNAETAASKTLKALPAKFRLALSGTPVENRLEDLRSLFDFVFPGYLGTPASFKKEFRVPIEVERREEEANRLKAITAPFLLRRLKTDKTVITDLPDKVTINEYAVLEKGQAALYESVVLQALEESEKATEPFERSALILKLLTSLKQVCDHPRAYDKESPSDAARSGKCALLLALLEEILRGREKVLIFSQYVEVLEILKTIIADELDERAILYYGGMTQKKRDEAVEKFQNEAATRIMLVSLKAGGLGLNLTAASRVIHFDLWYNPAVENQATDRAFRIGQKRNVFVHRFITRNTFEEKIEAMLESKRELAKMTVSSGESWLARMSHEELKALFK